MPEKAHGEHHLPEREEGPEYLAGRKGQMRKMRLRFNIVSYSPSKLLKKNEQPTLKPLEKKIIRDYGLEQIVVCTDAGLSSKTNRKFNDKAADGVQIRSFITTQSIKQLPEYLKDFALAPADGISPDASEHLT